MSPPTLDLRGLRMVIHKGATIRFPGGGQEYLEKHKYFFQFQSEFFYFFQAMCQMKYLFHLVSPSTQLFISDTTNEVKLKV